jgi:hypothetical protein
MKMFDDFRQWLCQPTYRVLNELVKKLHQLMDERGNLVKFSLSPLRCNVTSVSARFSGSTFSDTEVLTVSVIMNDGKDVVENRYPDKDYGKLVKFLLSYDFRVVAENQSMAQTLVSRWAEKMDELGKKKMLEERSNAVMKAADTLTALQAGDPTKPLSKKKKLKLDKLIK